MPQNVIATTMQLCLGTLLLSILIFFLETNARFFSYSFAYNSSTNQAMFGAVSPLPINLATVVCFFISSTFVHNQSAHHDHFTNTKPQKASIHNKNKQRSVSGKHYVCTLARTDAAQSRHGAHHQFLGNNVSPVH